MDRLLTVAYGPSLATVATEYTHCSLEYNRGQDAWGNNNAKNNAKNTTQR